jgi:predicted MFS family arabinose efflux permease
MLNPWRGLGVLPRQVWLICLTSLVNRAGTMVLPFLTLYATRELQLSAPEAGALLVFYGVASMVGSPLGGYLSDRFGPLRVMKVSLLLSGVLLLLLPLAQSYAAVAGLLVALAVVTETFRPANLAAISAAVPPEHLRPSFALARLAVNLGMSVGPAVGGILAGVSFFWLFVADGLTSIAASLVLVFSRVRDPARSPSSGERRGLLGGLSDPRLLLLLAGAIPVAVVFFQHASAMPLFLVQDLQLSESIYGLMFTLNTLLIVAIEVPLNLAISRWPSRFVLALGALLFGAGFGAMGLVDEVWGVAATVVVWTFGEMILFPGLSAAVAATAPTGRVGQYMGLYTLSFAVAFTVGPWAGTEVYAAFGSPILWGGAFALGIISAVLFALYRERAPAR